MDSTTTSSTTFGIALPIVSHGMAPGQFLREMTDEVIAAEEAGFGLCLVPEHHGGPGGSLTDPLVIATWLLARTARIRVGTGVLILPLYSLPRLAEQTATLQHASDGRFILGVGVGYQPQDFATFGADFSTRGPVTDAAIAGLREAWRTGELGGQQIRPTLSQRAAPELHIGAWTRSGLQRAAIADGWIADPLRRVEETAQAAALYRSLTRETGRPSKVTVMREAWVAETDEEAITAFAPVIEPIFRYYHRHGALGRAPAPSASELMLRGGLAERVIVGSPTTVLEQVRGLITATTADSVVFGLRHPGGPAHGRVLEVIARLGAEVLPQFRGQPRPGGALK